MVVENSNTGEQTEVVSVTNSYEFHATKPGTYKLVSMRDALCEGDDISG